MLKENKSLAERKVRTPRPGPQAPFPLLVSLPGLQHPSWLPMQRALTGLIPGLLWTQG